jgi:hypothetical protein
MEHAATPGRCPCPQQRYGDAGSTLRIFGCGIAIGHVGTCAQRAAQRRWQQPMDAHTAVFQLIGEQADQCRKPVFGHAVATPVSTTHAGRIFQCGHDGGIRRTAQ